MLKRWLTSLAFLLASCTYYGTTSQIDDWPYRESDIFVHQVTEQEARDVCAQYAPPLAYAHACAIYYVWQCHVWVPEGPEYQWALENELNNCRGLVKPYWHETLEKIRDQVIELRKQENRKDE